MLPVACTDASSQWEAGLTATEQTPGSALRVELTSNAQAAQLMPHTGRRIVQIAREDD